MILDRIIPAINQLTKADMFLFLLFTSPPVISIRISTLYILSLSNFCSMIDNIQFCKIIYITTPVKENTRVDFTKNLLPKEAIMNMYNGNDK
jgi:hypothetical protein